MMEIFKKYRKLLLVALPFISLLALWWLMSRPLSPDAVCSLTVQSLETGNVDLLLRLSHTTEQQKLNLTHFSVKAFLAETIWQGDKRPKLTYKRLPSRVDEAEYQVNALPGLGNGLNYPFYICIADSPDKGWQLLLSRTMFNTTKLRWRTDTLRELVPYFNSVATQYGIRGRYDHIEGFRYLDESREPPIWKQLTQR